MDPPANMKHSSTIVAVIRQRGGGDPHIQIIQSCGKKDINGVRNPSLRASPHCEISVQHTEACKQINCPACKKDFCFAGLKPKIHQDHGNVVIQVLNVLLLPDKQAYLDDDR